MMMIWEISWCRNGWPPSLRCLFRFHLRELWRYLFRGSSPATQNGSTSNPSAKRNIVGLPKETVLTIRESSSIAKKGSTSNASTERNHSIISAVPKKSVG
ncbi:uncharacterized protein LOC124893197 isoform X4 [Capsicum annuum]|uniref:uncharacterized protein LOC124893197 isoform X4 n=1 Tax=Capsicum annuum TaxID=4072 RepID=UPI001FB18C2A|nr:uncharacterized protein LOC124893197 isoform X4 [Capsicum annuum]